MKHFFTLFLAGLLALPALSQETTPETKKSEEPREAGLKKIVSMHYRNADEKTVPPAVEAQIGELLTDVLKTVEQTLELLQINIVPVEINLKSLDAALAPLEAKLPLLNIDLEQLSLELDQIVVDPDKHQLMNWKNKGKTKSDKERKDKSNE